MTVTILNTALEWLKQGLYIPLFVLIIGVLGYVLYKTITKNAENREKYLMDVLDKKDVESKEDKKSYLNALELYHKGMSEITMTIKEMNTTFSMRLDFIEKKIDDIK